MKYIKMLSLAAAVSFMFSSCDDMIMEWYKDPNKGEVAMSDLPLPLAEKIERYEVLKNYTDFKLGVGVGLDFYMNNETYRNIVNANFDEVVIGYEMKHGAMVGSNGQINFTKVDAMLAQVQEAGLTMYGHTLVWHQNQNASYLNGLIAPTVLPDAPGANSIDLTGLKNGSFSGWTRNNPGDGISVEDGKGLSATAKAVVMKSSASSANAWNLQLTTPDITIVPNHTYEVSFFVKSDIAGKGRISFSGLNNNYPWMDWYANGSTTEAFVTNSTWKQVVFTLNANDDAFTGASFKMNFDLGYLPGVTYYIDVDNIKVVDKDAAPTIVNLISNGDFEDGTLTGWGGWGNSSTRAVSAQGEGFGDTGYSMVLTNPTAASNYSAQQVYTFSTPLEQDVEYNCTFMVKASTTAALQVEIQGANYNADYYGGITVGTTWTQVQKTLKPTKADRDKFIFDFGETAATFYIDNIVVSKNTPASVRRKAKSVTIIEKTDEEKRALIDGAMTHWIQNMMTHYKDNVKAWDVVNEPMKENGTLRDGDVAEQSTDEFYWVKYLGKDFAVKAFKLAREYGNPDNVLFINDYNLEYSLQKCDGLIEYVQYIESQGATVDGIGTQMHISITSDTAKIRQMFQKLGATGKLIKVSELDIKVNTSSPTLDDYAKQSEMYRFVIESYKKYIPKDKQYGITIWGVSDHPDEHEYWIPDDAPNLWDKEYKRKHAYKGTADGLAGKDVSVDFSGELVY